MGQKGGPRSAGGALTSSLRLGLSAGASDNADESSYSNYYGLMAPRSFNAAAAQLRWSQTIPARCVKGSITRITPPGDTRGSDRRAHLRPPDRQEWTRMATRTRGAMRVHAPPTTFGCYVGDNGPRT
jgi:hypothetical protein